MKRIYRADELRVGDILVWVFKYSETSESNWCGCVARLSNVIPNNGVGYARLEFVDVKVKVGDWWASRRGVDNYNPFEESDWLAKCDSFKEALELFHRKRLFEEI